MTPAEELDKINEVLDMFKVPKDEGYAIYTTLGRVSWLARKSAQQSVQLTCGRLGNFSIVLVVPHATNANR